MIGIVQALLLAFPITVAVLTEILKRLPAIPISSKNAKLTAFVISCFVVMIITYDSGQLNPTYTVQIATEIVGVYVMAVGFYETAKNLIKKLIG